MQETIKIIIDNNECKFFFTADLWTTRNAKLYFGVTLHFIVKAWRFQSLPIFLSQTVRDNTDLKYAKLLMQTLEKNDIKQKSLRNNAQ